MTDTLTPEHRSWVMGRIRGKNTKPEIMVRSVLHRMGYRFRINCRDLPGRPDIVLPKYKTIVFVHGCFWHRHKGCSEATMPKSRTEYVSVLFSSCSVGRPAQLAEDGQHYRLAQRHKSR